MSGWFLFSSSWPFFVFGFFFNSKQRLNWELPRKRKKKEVGDFLVNFCLVSEKKRGKRKGEKKKKLKKL